MNEFVFTAFNFDLWTPRCFFIFRLLAQIWQFGNDILADSHSRRFLPFQSGLVPASVKIISDNMNRSIPAYSGRCWTTRSWLYKILTSKPRALSHPWYRTELLFWNKGFLFGSVKWRLMSSSSLFRFHTKSLFCMNGWSKQKRVKNCPCSMFLLKHCNHDRKQQVLQKI